MPRQPIAVNTGYPVYVAYATQARDNPASISGWISGGNTT